VLKSSRETQGSLAVKAGFESNREVGKRLLTPGEAAAYLGLKVDTVYKKARLRELPSVKVGRALRFDVVALNRYVEQHTIDNLE
jgi:excisionase family DNA binding protein